MTPLFSPRLWLVSAFSIVGVGCASVKTLPVGAESETTRMRRPVAIFVQGFETSGGMWQRSAASPEKRAEIRDWLSGSLLRYLAPLAPTHLLEGETRPEVGWLVTGRFLRVNPGSRFQRAFLGGVGAGASKMETRVDVYDLAASSMEPVLSFSTTGGSNLAGGIQGVMSATDSDVDRTAREIHRYLEDRLWPADSVDGGPPSPAAIDEVDIKARPRRGR